MTLARAKAGCRPLNHSSKLKPLGGQYFYRGAAHERSPNRLQNGRRSRHRRLKETHTLVLLLLPY